MSIPESLRIGPYTYAVQFEDSPRGDRNEELYGHIIYGPQVVKIQGGLSHDRTMAIILHEAIHGLDELLALGLTEKQVQRLAPALFAFLRDNNFLNESQAT